MDERATRIGYNEALFREVNERVRELEHGFGRAKTLELVCECGDETCTGKLAMAAERYEELRSHPDRFAVIPGHEVPALEGVVSEADGFFVVEKHSGEPTVLAERTDPRS